MEIRSDRRYDIAAEPEVVWPTLSSVADFPTWWSWLERFDGERLAAGEQWNCVVRPPLPYRVHFTVTIDEVVERSSVVATIRGDIAGTARVDVTPAAPGSTLRLRSALGPSQAWLRVLARVARPLVAFGHDWVLDTGAKQFSSRLAAKAATSDGSSDEP